MWDKQKTASLPGSKVIILILKIRMTRQSPDTTINALLLTRLTLRVYKFLFCLSSKTLQTPKQVNLRETEKKNVGYTGWQR